MPATLIALRQFRHLFGHAPMYVMRAPARINILGEHVDYVRYLPTASLAFGSREHAMTMLVRATDDGCVRGASTDAEFAPFAFRLDECAPDGSVDWEEWVFGRPAPAPDWSNYARGAVYLGQWKYGRQITRGFEFLIDSSVPARAGASSSSALVVLAGAALRLVNQIEFTRAELAQDSARAEWFLGTRGGALDHTAICLAEANHAVHIAHAQASTRLLPLTSQSHRWITFFSHPADKGRAVMLEYNERAAVSRIVIPALLAQQRATDAAFAQAWSAQRR